MSTTREALRIWRWHWASPSVGIVLPILGLFFIIGGVYPIPLGTVYCLRVGCGLAAIAPGLIAIAACDWSLRAYFIVLPGTLTCAVPQVGFERFDLAPRLWLPNALGIYLIMPWASHRFDDHWGAFGIVVVAGVVICRWPWFIPRGIHGTLTARGLIPVPMPLPAADANQYEQRKTGDGIRVHALPQDATTGSC